MPRRKQNCPTRKENANDSPSGIPSQDVVETEDEEEDTEESIGILSGKNNNKNNGTEEITQDLEEKSNYEAAPIDAHICGYCRSEFVGLNDFLQHKKECPAKVLPPVLLTDDEDLDDRGREGEDDDEEEEERQSPDLNEGDERMTPTESSVPSRALESTLTTLQQQQMILMSVIQQLHSQITAQQQQGSVAGSNGSMPVLPPGMFPFLVPPSLSNTTGLQESQKLESRISEGERTRKTSTSSSSSRHSRSRRSSSLSPTTKSSPVTTASISQGMGSSGIPLSISSYSARSSNKSLERVTCSPSSGRSLRGGSSPPPSSSLHPSLLSSHRHLLSSSCLPPPSISPASSSSPASKNNSVVSPVLSASTGVKHPNQESRLSSLQSMTKALTSSSNEPLFLHSKLVSSPASSTEGSGILNTIISPSDPTTVSSSSTSLVPESTNTLALLEMHTEKALQNTMSGSSFLVNGISPGSGGDFLKFRKDGKEDPAYRHRCRYCGKVFGSDSALQIHIRSHTGERPFKCNVCGNRFSTKGNLKVHFQRHRAKYPHVKMNPNPVPEHLDKFHPPLEPPSGSQSPTRSESSPPPSGVNPLSQSSNPFAILGHSASSIPVTSSVSEGLSTSLFESRNFGQDFAPRSMFASFLNQLKAREAKEASQSLNKESKTPAGESQSKKNHCNPKESLEDASHNDTSNSSHESEDNRKMKRRSSSNGSALIKKLKSDQTSSSSSKGGEEKRNGNQNTDKDQESQDDEEDDARSKQDTHEDNQDDDELDREPIDDMTNDSNDFSRSGHDDGGEDEDLDTDGAISNQGSNNGSFPPFMSGFHGFPPGFFPGMMPPLGQFPGRSTGSTSGQNDRDPSMSAAALSQDPHLYQDLLPKPGSNDNSWESLMEIQKASETTKLQNLVDNIDQKVTDPNQCIICHRVLSCKSALQMHYRTHTGERPFKCKICTRAFTTKGNLKTHMGVHRVKPPLRILHQCPVCHKQFTNALVLQQHIRMHTGEPTDIPHEHIMANEVKHPQFLPPSFLPYMTGLPHHALNPRHPLMTPFGSPIPVTSASSSSAPPGINPFFAQLMSGQLNHTSSQMMPSVSDTSSTPKIKSKGSVSHDEESDGEDESSPKNNGNRESPSNSSPVSTTPSKDCETKSPRLASSPKSKEGDDNKNGNDFSESLTALENHVKTIYENNKMDAADLSDSGVRTRRQTSLPSDVLGKLKERGPSSSPASIGSKDTSIDERSTPGSVSRPVDDVASSHSLGSDVLSPLAALVGNGALDLTPRSTAAVAAPVANVLAMTTRLTSPVTTPLLRPQMFPPLFAGLPFHAGKSSTTCRICLKTFACNSALEIHYRSHTKERPFKCEVCDRGFSTKGNMKQHMLTHKIRDLPSSLYTHTTTTPSASNSTTTTSNLSMTKNGTPSLTDSNSQSSLGVSLNESDNESKVSPGENGQLPDNLPSVRHDSGSCSPSRRSSSNSSRHVCVVCTKPFSSHSALQIHMRTHTGDKPFKCGICGRAFTTKGNLKVHMGTHMWSNACSRRGRRLSIHLPSLENV